MFTEDQWTEAKKLYSVNKRSLTFKNELPKFGLPERVLVFVQSSEVVEARE
jgi:hypothetical protein